jgi:hypothetical protein
MNKPELNDTFAKTKLKPHKTFGGKVVEILYGAKDEQGNPCAPKEGVEDGHGRWFGIEVNGDYRMFSWTHSKDEGGNTEYGTDHEDHALEDMEAEILKKRDLARNAEVLARDYSGDDAEEKMNALKEEWSKLTVWDTPVEKEYQVRFDKAFGEFEPRQEEIKKNKADKEAVVAKAEELKNAENFKDARNILSSLRDELYAIGSAGAEADATFRSALNKIERELRDKQKEYNANRDERMASAKQKKEEIIASAKQVTTNVKNWKNAGDKLNSLFEEWKAAGNSGKDTDDALWEQFSAIRKEFNTARNAFFTERSAKWEESIATKEKLISEAKEISAKNDFGKENTGRMKELDKEWRAAGYSGKDKNDALWDAFNEAKEVFWDAKKAESLKKIQNIVDRKKSELESLKKKIEDLEFRIEIAPNPMMKEDSERELHLREVELEKLSASIEEDEKKLSDNKE